MRRLQCNQVSFILAGIVLQIIASEFYHGADCLALKKLKIHGIVEPLLNKFRKSDSDGSSFFNIDEGILSSLSEKAVGLLGSFAKTGKKGEGLPPKGITFESPKEGPFTASQKESSTEVDGEEDNKLFFNSENDPEPAEEEENVEPRPQQEFVGDGKTVKEYSDSLIISVLHDIYDFDYYEPFP